MANEVYWTMKDGTKISVDDMDLTHLRNTLKLIIRNRDKAVKRSQEFKLHGDIANMYNDDLELEEYRDIIEYGY